MKPALAVAACVFAASAASHATAQSLAARISAERDGTVRLSFAARPGLCGDGESTVRAGNAVFVLPGMFGRERDRRDVICYSGPVRVSVVRASGATSNVRVHVGGRWAPGETVTDLGTVSAPEAARYFAAEARSLSPRNAEFAIAAAALADSTALAADLDKLARDQDVRASTRGYAVMWIGFFGGDEGRRYLRALVNDGAVGNDLRGHAIVAIAQRDIDPDDARFLQAAYPSLPEALHDEVFLALSRTGEPSVHRWLADHVVDRSEPLETRKQALFWAGQGDMPMAQLIAIRPRLESLELREHFTFVLSQRQDEAAVDALIDIAKNDPSRELRKRALFWLGASKSPKARAYLVSVIQG